MPEKRKISFSTEKSIRYRPEFDVVNCERIRQADIDGDGCVEIVVLRCGSSGDRSVGEVAVYDLDLNLKASDRWDGTAMDVAVADVDGDGVVEIVVAGGIKNSSPMIRVYTYNENYKDNLELSSQTTWGAPEGLFSTAKAIHVSDVDGQVEIAVLSIVEGNKDNNGYAQLRLYDADMRLESVARWTPMGGQIVKWGHCMAAADIDGDGRDELVSLINFRHEGKQKADLRAFDQNLVLKRHCEALADQSLFATCMTAADIDGDGRAEIVLAGGVFTKVWQGATNQLMVFDGELGLRGSTTWKTFRHSWVWDLQIADVDGDGKQEFITYGGTSMVGRNQNDANIMGEVCVWNSESLTVEDMFIWQSKPGEDTRPSRGFALRAEGHTRFVIATSKWSRRQHVPELEIRTLKYEPATGVIDRYSSLVKAYEEKNIEALGAFVGPEDLALSPLALEALATCGGEAAKAISRVLGTKDQPLFLRAVELLRNTGAIDELRAIGFTITDDWAIISPFDNLENAGFDKQYPPEVEIDLNAFYAGKNRIVRWGEIQESEWESRRGIYVDLAYNYFDSFERTGIEHDWNALRTRSVAYALTYIHSPAAIEAQLRTGNTDGVKIWLGGELESSSDTNRNAALEQEIIPVSLAEGKNRLLLKIANNGTNEWGFYLRITDREGRYIPELRYERPALSHIHNQMLTNEQLASLLDAQNDHLRCLAASQLAPAGDRRGNETLSHLLKSEDSSVRAGSALALTLAGDHRGLDPLVEYAPEQNHHFQVAAGYALNRAGDARAERFSIANLKDENGKSILELKVSDRDNGFYVTPLFRGNETARIDVGTSGDFHLGDNVSTKYATIMGFGVPESQYRGMGLGSIAIQRACELMAEQGCSCSTVGTGTRLVAHRLYVRHGYVDRRFPCEYKKSLEEADAVESDSNMNVRDYTDSDGEDLNKIREQYLRNTVGPTNWSPRSNFGPWVRVLEDDGKTVGYAYVNLDPFEPGANVSVFVDSDFSDEPAAVRELLSGAHRYAMAEGKKTITFDTPPMRYRDILRGMGYQIDHDSLRHGWVNMFKVIDLAKFLGEMSGLLSLRLQRSAHAGWTGSMGIKGSRLGATVVIDSDGSINVESAAADAADLCVITDDATITSLVSGDGEIWGWYKQHILTVKPIFNERLRSLMESLFPVMDCRQGGWW